MNADLRIQFEAHAFLIEKAPVVFFMLSSGGEILAANRYVQALTGRSLIGEALWDVLVDLSESFDLTDATFQNAKEKLLTVSTASGLPQSFYFTFKAIDDSHLLAIHIRGQP